MLAARRRLWPMLIVGALLLGLTPAAAWADGGLGGVTCPSPASCRVHAQRPGRGGGVEPGPVKPPAGGAGRGGASVTMCADHAGVPMCRLPGASRDEGGGAGPVVTPAELGAAAATALRLPSPRIVLNPPVSRSQVVRLPTWMWIPASSWSPRSAVAAVPGVSVTATARPTGVRWDMGDGTVRACAGPGTAWRPGMNPRASSPDCGHVFRRSSQRSTGGVFRVRATVSWRVTWRVSDGSASGMQPGMSTSSTVGVRVVNASSLN